MHATHEDGESRKVAQLRRIGFYVKSRRYYRLPAID